MTNFDWNEYLYLAEELCQRIRPTVSEECLFRNVASRAYYGAYNAARKAAEKQGACFPKKGAAHSQVPGWYKKIGKLDIADRLKNLRIWRNKCDYADRVQCPKDLATKALLESKIIVARL